jgi:hypothetical protein
MTQEKTGRIFDTAILPSDADGDALRRVIAKGSDLSRELEIDFHVAVEDRASALESASAVQPLGFRTNIFKDSQDDLWTCECTRTMIPTYETLIAIQKQLEKIGRPYGARPDGWGTFGNAQR